MRYVVVAVLLAFGLTGCYDRSVRESRLAAQWLDGKTVRDKDGCVYSVTQGSQSSVGVRLRHLREFSDDTCLLNKPKG